MLTNTVTRHKLSHMSAVDRTFARVCTVGVQNQSQTCPRVITVTEDGDVLRSVRDFMDRTGLSERQVRYMIKRGESPPVIRVSKQKIAFREKDIQAWEARRAMESTSALPSREERNKIADALIEAARCMRDGDEHGMAAAINGSRFPLKFFVYEAISMLAFADSKSDGGLLDALARVAGTPTD